MEVKIESPSKDTLIKSYNHFATSNQILTQRVQFYFEEFDGVKLLVEFNKMMADNLKAQIDKIEAEEAKNVEAEPSKEAVGTSSKN